MKELNEEIIEQTEGEIGDEIAEGATGGANGIQGIRTNLVDISSGGGGKGKGWIISTGIVPGGQRNA